MKDKMGVGCCCGERCKFGCSLSWRPQDYETYSAVPVTVDNWILEGDYWQLTNLNFPFNLTSGFKLVGREGRMTSKQPLPNGSTPYYKFSMNMEVKYPNNAEVTSGIIRVGIHGGDTLMEYDYSKPRRLVCNGTEMLMDVVQDFGTRTDLKTWNQRVRLLLAHGWQSRDDGRSPNLYAQGTLLNNTLYWPWLPVDPKPVVMFGMFDAWPWLISSGSADYHSYYGFRPSTGGTGTGHYIEFEGIPEGVTITFSSYRWDAVAPTLHCVPIREESFMWGFQDMFWRKYDWLGGTNPYPVSDISFGSGFPARPNENQVNDGRASVYQSGADLYKGDYNVWRLYSSDLGARGEGEWYRAETTAVDHWLTPNLNNKVQRGRAVDAWDRGFIEGSRITVDLLGLLEGDVARVAVNRIDEDNYVFADIKWVSRDARRSYAIYEVSLWERKDGEDTFKALNNVKVYDDTQGGLYQRRLRVRLAAYSDKSVECLAVPVHYVGQWFHDVYYTALLAGGGTTDHFIEMSFDSTLPRVVEETGVVFKELRNTPSVSYLHVSPSEEFCEFLPLNKYYSNQAYINYTGTEVSTYSRFGNFELNSTNNGGASVRIDTDEDPDSDWRFEVTFGFGTKQPDGRIVSGPHPLEEDVDGTGNYQIRGGYDGLKIHFGNGSTVETKGLVGVDASDFIEIVHGSVSHDSSTIRPQTFGPEGSTALGPPLSMVVEKRGDTLRWGAAWSTGAYSLGKSPAGSIRGPGTIGWSVGDWHGSDHYVRGSMRLWRLNSFDYPNAYEYGATYGTVSSRMYQLPERIGRNNIDGFYMNDLLVSDMISEGGRTDVSVRFSDLDFYMTNNVNDVEVPMTYGGRYWESFYPGDHTLIHKYGQNDVYGSVQRDAHRGYLFVRPTDVKTHATSFEDLFQTLFIEIEPAFLPVALYGDPQYPDPYLDPSLGRDMEVTLGPVMVGSYYPTPTYNPASRYGASYAPGTRQNLVGYFCLSEIRMIIPVLHKKPYKEYFQPISTKYWSHRDVDAFADRHSFPAFPVMAGEISDVLPWHIELQDGYVFQIERDRFEIFWIRTHGGSITIR